MTGWACGYFSTPQWMLKRFDVWLVLMFCGAIVGPLGLFWFAMNKGLEK